MAALYVSGALWGNVLSSEHNPEFPCMDTNYRELTWTFSFVKSFSSFNAMLTYEKTTIPTYFSSREKTVTYGAATEDNCVLQKLARKNILSPLNQDGLCYAEYDAVFTKEG